jgi:nucleotide-binding universal stress UspA family protein
MNTVQSCPAGKLEKILVASDRSQFSDRAVAEAIELAKGCSSVLYVISTLEMNPAQHATTGLGSYLKEEAEVLQYLNTVKEKAAGAGITCETVFHSGVEPSQAIMDEAIKRDVDIIVVGRRGRKGLLNALMGEVATKVVAHAPCKVLVVPKDAKVEYRNILVATDGSGHSLIAVDEAVNIAKRFGSTLIALSSIRSEEEREKAQVNITKALDMAKSEGIAAEGLIPTGRSFNLIAETAMERGANLIVMGMPVKSALGKIFTGSATEQVIGKAECAVLIVKGDKSISSTV